MSHELGLAYGAHMTLGGGGVVCVFTQRSNKRTGSKGD